MTVRDGCELWTQFLLAVDRIEDADDSAVIQRKERIMKPNNDNKEPSPWELLSKEEQLQIIEQLVAEEVAAGRIAELLPVNGKRTYILAKTLEQN